jgi:hypothetical protein
MEQLVLIFLKCLPRGVFQSFVLSAVWTNLILTLIDQALLMFCCCILVVVMGKNDILQVSLSRAT